jgi:hypothetical protein
MKNILHYSGNKLHNSHLEESCIYIQVAETWRKKSLT